MENNKKKKPIASIICFIIGACLIILGIVLPQILFKMPKNIFSVDASAFGDKYEFEIETNKKLNLETANVKIKIEGVETKTFPLTYRADESENGDYVFTLWLTDDDAHMFNEVIEVEIETESGEKIVFENEDKYDNFGSNSKKIILTVIPCFFGVFFLMMGLTFIFAKKGFRHIKRVNDKIMSSLFGEDEDIDQKDVDHKNQKTEIKTIACKYCGIENDESNAKCEHCGAPLIRNKKK